MKRPHRQICGLCHRADPLAFWVPDEIWLAVVHREHRHTIHCFTCFVERADESLIEWEKEIKFHPVSMYTQMRITLDKKNWVDNKE